MSVPTPHIFGWSDLTVTKKPMTLDEAIEHALSVAERNRNTLCGVEHLNLAFWLRELRQRRADAETDRLLKSLDEYKDTFMGMPLKEATKLVGGARVFKLALESIRQRAESALGTCCQDDKAAFPNALKEIAETAKNALAENPFFFGVDLAKPKGGAK